MYKQEEYYNRFFLPPSLPDTRPSNLQFTRLSKRNPLCSINVSPEDIQLIDKLLDGQSLMRLLYQEDNQDDFLLDLLRKSLLLTAEPEGFFLRMRLADKVAHDDLSKLREKWVKQNQKYVVIFDINDVLLEQGRCSKGSQLFLWRYGAITVDNQTYYIAPGVTELLFWLFSMYTVRVAFFNSVDESQAQPKINALLLKVLGEKRCAEILRDIKILSVKDCFYASGEDREAQLHHYGIISDLKKDIRKIVEIDEPWYNAIFIGDQYGAIHRGQEGNYLAIEPLWQFYYNPFSGKRPCNQPNDTLFRILNNFFYCANVLQKCFQSKQSVSNTLLTRHFIKTTPIPTYTPSWKIPSLKEYQEGVTLLQQFNPKLQLITEKFYQSCLTGKECRPRGRLNPSLGRR